MLTADDESALAASLRQHPEGSPLWVRARNALVYAGMHHAEAVAVRYVGRCSLDVDDLTAIAHESLMTAAVKHDPERGRFRATAKVYAAKFIRQAIGQDRAVPLSERAIREAARIRKIETAHEARTGDMPTDGEVVDAYCRAYRDPITARRVAELRSDVTERALSLDAAHHDGGATLGDLLAADPIVSDGEAHARSLLAERLLACLPPRFRRALRLNMGMGLDVGPVAGKDYAAAWERHPHRARRFAVEARERLCEIVQAMPAGERRRAIDACGL